MLDIVCVILGVLAPVLVYRYKKEWVAYYFIATCFLTEFYYINIAGGKIRFYHLAAVVVIFLLHKQWLSLFHMVQIRLIALFVGYALVSALISHNRSGAVKSWISLVINVCIAVAVVLVLQTRLMTVEQFKQTVCYLAIIECIMGILQYSVLFIGKFNIGLSIEQQSQINIGMLPAFSTEANVFGRSILITMILLLPDLVYKKTKIKGLYILYVLATFCTMINMTRTGLYPALLVLIGLTIYFIKQGVIKQYLKIISCFAALVIGIVILANLKVLPAAEYTTYKWKAFASLIKVDTEMLLPDSGESVSAQDVERGNVESWDETVKGYYEQQSLQENNIQVALDRETQEAEQKENVNEQEDLVEDQEYDVKWVDDTYDVSSSYRVSTAILVLKSMFESPATFLFGRGWGQTYFVINRYASQAGAGDWGNIFAYTGIIGLLIYLLVTVNVLKITFTEVKKNKSNKITALGVLCGCLILGMAGVLSSNIIMPGFWILVGLATFMEQEVNEKA